MNGFVFERSSHEQRSKALCFDRCTSNFVDQVVADFFLREQQLHHFVAVHRQAFKHFLTVLISVIDHVCWHVFDDNVLAFVARVAVGFHFDQVNDTVKIFAQADWNLEQQHNAAQLLTHLVSDFERIGTGTVHFVDERQTWNTVTLHLTVNGQRLSLHATDRAKYQDGTIEHAQ